MKEGTIKKTKKKDRRKKERKKERKNGKKQIQKKEEVLALVNTMSICLLQVTTSPAFVRRKQTLNNVILQQIFN